ncbi:MAG: protein-L-isoaspartate O-methyltransferase family protein [Gammaproteobacteria bacterium]
MLETNFEQARIQMVGQQIRGWGVLDPDVVQVMGRLPREKFVPARYRNLAYADSEIPIAHGQIMLRPSVHGRLLQAVQVAHGERVLEIGTGSGYLTACLAALGGDVRSLEYHEELTRDARATLAGEGFDGVEVVCEDTRTLDADGPEYDVIVVTGSLPDADRNFMRRLAVGGRLFWFLGQAPAMRAELVTRVEADEWRREGQFETVVPALIGTEPLEQFKL